MTRIIDIEWCELDARFQAPAEHILVRLWRDDWPVGQFYDQGTAGRSLDLRKLAESAVSSEILDYAASGIARNTFARDVGDVSVVICTRDRPDALIRCLTSLAKQTLRPRQILVVDNASVDDRTRIAALDAGADYVRENRPGLDIARNTGASAAHGSIVAYTDDDVVVHPRWLERLVAAFDDEKIGCVTGLVLPAELETEAQCLFEQHWSFGRGFLRIDFDEAFYAEDHRTGCPVWEIGAGASMAFRRDVFGAAGEFDHRLDVGAAGCSGDSEYWHRLLSRGYTCRYEPGAVAYHFHRPEMQALSSQIFHYMRGHTAALLVQYERTGNKGNLRRLMRILPHYFSRRVLMRTFRGVQGHNRFLHQEIAGFLSGILFYLRNRGSRTPPGDAAANPR